MVSSLDLQGFQSQKGNESHGNAQRRSESERPRAAWSPRRGRERSSTPSRHGNQSMSASHNGGWHSEGVPLDSIHPGDRMPGIVTNLAPFGAFVDVGATRNAKLILEPRLCRRFQVGDRLDCVVKEVELEKSRFLVTLLDADLELAENRIPLEELAEGDLVDGIIDHTNPHGIWVNVGAVVIGRLNVPRRYTNHLVVGQCIRDIIIQRIDLKQTKLGLTMDDPEVLLRETVMISDLLRGSATGPAAPSTTPSARGSSMRTQAVPPLGTPREAEPRPSPEHRPHRATKEVEATKRETSLRVGQFVDGIVVEVSSSVVMVDIGLGHLAALAVIPSVRSQLQREDEIQGMRVERVDWDEQRQKGAVVLSLEDPQLTSGEPSDSPRWHDYGWQGQQNSWWSSWNRDWDWTWRNDDRGWYQDSWWR